SDSEVRNESFAGRDIPLADSRMAPDLGRNGTAQFDAVESEWQIESRTMLRGCGGRRHLEATIEEARMGEIRAGLEQQHFGWQRHSGQGFVVSAPQFAQCPKSRTESQAQLAAQFRA